ncbi:hypothetical protein B0H11DRAFT_1920911 [Mycena galericulata]|nr:hypothetical protein B0H11DRAFT_1920911 [Mycena galericulata]
MYQMRDGQGQCRRRIQKELEDSGGPGVEGDFGCQSTRGCTAHQYPGRYFGSQSRPEVTSGQPTNSQNLMVVVQDQPKYDVNGSVEPFAPNLRMGRKPLNGSNGSCANRLLIIFKRRFGYHEGMG